MKKLYSLNLKFQNSSENNILSIVEMTQSETELYIFDSNDINDDYEWGSEIGEKQVLISVDDILLNQPGLLMRHERHLLDDVYEDDLFYPKITQFTNLTRILFFRQIPANNRAILFCFCIVFVEYLSCIAGSCLFA